MFRPPILIKVQHTYEGACVLETREVKQLEAASPGKNPLVEVGHANDLLLLMDFVPRFQVVVVSDKVKDTQVLHKCLIVGVSKPFI